MDCIGVIFGIDVFGVATYGDGKPLNFIINSLCRDAVV
jgi:hypothetical protein